MTLRQIARSIRRAQERRIQRVFARRWDGTTDMAARVALEEGQEPCPEPIKISRQLRKDISGIYKLLDRKDFA